MATQQQFTTRIIKSGSRLVCMIPFDPNQVWGEKERHYVSGTVNGCTVRGSLGLEGKVYFLSLGAVWLRDNDLDEGAGVEVVLSPEGPQVGNMAADVASALESEPRARDFFDSLPTFYRKNYMRWIESAKRPETRSARIAVMVELLKAGKKER